MTTKTREDYRKAFARCQGDDNCPFAGVEVHEIPRGIYRKEASNHRCALLLLCRVHHDAMGNYKVWPIARQLARKLLVDGDYFDLETICEIRDRVPTAITLVDVAKYLRMRE